MSPEILREMKRFSLRFQLSTEGVSYTALVPLAVLYFWLNTNLSGEQTLLLLKCTLFGVGMITPITAIWDARAIKPITDYCAKILAGEEPGDDLCLRAQRRFFSLPFQHAVGSMIRWSMGITFAAVPFVYLANLTRVQLINMIMLYFVIPPLSCVLFFLLTEIYLQKLLNKGFFDRLVLKEFSLSLSFTTRILITTIILGALPLMGVVGYYNLVIDSVAPTYEHSFVRLGGIMLFGLITAVSVLWAMLRSIRDKISIIVGFLNRVGAGDLAAEKGIIAVMDDLTRINQTVYVMKKNITEMINEISGISRRLDASANETSNITESFMQDTQSQAATVEQMTATMEEISSGMDSVSRSAKSQVDGLQALVATTNQLTGTIVEMEQKIKSTTSLTGSITGQARRGEESLMRMRHSMDTIQESSSKMSSIINIINDISDKINLLSLNAAIEAARAGDAGRGFAVVADEISKLADSTAASVKEIDTLIKGSESEIATGTTIVAEVVDLISSITAGISDMNAMMASIADFMKQQVAANHAVDQKVSDVRGLSEEIEAATREQKTAMTEVVQAINRINELTQSISAGSEEIAANTRQNANMADALKGKVDQFKLA